MKTKNNQKRFPHLTSDEAAERFLKDVDLSEYDFSDFKTVHFEFEAKSKPVSLRLPESLYKVVQKKAKTQGIKTQKFIRQALEKAVS